MKTALRLVAGVTLLSGALTIHADAATAVVADRQAYVSDEAVDPYANDAAAIHVGVVAGGESARSFVHLDLSKVQGAAVGTLLLKLVPSGDAVSNANSSAAHLQACMLTQVLAQPFNPSAPPAFDCKKGSADGAADATGVWTFDVTGFVAIWATNGDTGLAVVPAGTLSPSDNWSIAFDRTKTAGQAELAAPTQPPSASGQASVPVLPPQAVLPPPQDLPPLALASAPPSSLASPASIASRPPTAVAHSQSGGASASGAGRLDLAALASALVLAALLVLAAVAARSSRFLPRQVAGAGRQLQHYDGPIALAIVALLVVALIPSTVATLPGAEAGQSSSSAVPGGDISSSGGAPAQSPGGGPTFTPGGNSPTALLGPGSGGASPVANLGAQCGAGVRQVSWSLYADSCAPAFSGPNGGATSHGVSGNQVTVVLRLLNDSTATALGLPSNSQEVADYQNYIAIFNRYFQTYGRTVVLKTFNGQGNQELEVADQGQAGANADAQTAYDSGGFLAIDPGTSGEYDDALNSRHIISLGALHTSQTAYDNYAPYRYGLPLWPVANQDGSAMAAMACQRMVGMPAKFAGDASYQAMTRVFGGVEPEQPDYAGALQALQADGKSHCGLTLKQTATYSTDYTNAAQQATSIVAQFKAAGITTVFTSADPLFFPVLTSEAARAQYYPEWIQIWSSDAATRKADSSELAHTMELGVTGQQMKCSTRESYKVLAQFGKTPQSPCGLGGLDSIYWTVLELFNSLQNAGPKLNPSSFRQGWAATPPAHGGYGFWQYNPKEPDPAADFTLTWWSATAVSADDGQQGALQACDSGARWNYPYATNMGSGQLHCFGG